MMSIVQAVRSSLSVKISLSLAVVLLVLTAAAAAVITVGQTRQMEEVALEKARLAATSAARQYGDVFDAAIDSGQLTVADVFDQGYNEIKGWNFGEKPKFHTRYDTYTDKAVLVFQDKILDHPEYIYAVGLDVNGYVPTHNSIYQKPLTGDPAKDLAGNRTKRKFFNNTTEQNRAKNLEPFLLQVYSRDTGEILWDASAPIWVKGKHWGAFVLGVSMKQIEARQMALIRTLISTFAVFVLVTIGAIFVMLRRSMGPVVALTAAAEAISVGDGLDTPIRSDQIDEIGQLTKAVERLRVSMRAAMSRLTGQ
jgi:HAMP domain-containing protein